MESQFVRGVRASLVVLLPLAVPLSAAGAQAHSARTPVQVDGSGLGDPDGVAVASSGDLTAVIFEDNEAQRIYVATADGRALAFNDPVRIDSDPTGADKFTGDRSEMRRSSIAVSGDAIYATWMDESNAAPGGSGGIEARDVYFARSLDRGATWEADFPLDKGYPAGGDDPVENWVLAVEPSPSGDRVYVLMQVDQNYFSQNGREIYLTASGDGGQTFEPAVQVAPGFDVVRRLGMAAQGDTIHVAFTGLETFSPTAKLDVYYARSTDGGATFSTPLLVAGSPPLVDIADDEVSIGASGSLVAIAWPADADFSTLGTNVHVAVSTDGGTTFGDDQIVGEYPRDSMFLYSTTLAVANGRVAVAWNDNRSGGVLDQHVYATHSDDGGVTWTPDEQLSDTLRASGSKLIAAPNGDMAVHWIQPQFALSGAFLRASASSWAGGLIDLTGALPIDPGTELDQPDLAYNERYGNVVHVWIAEDAGNERHVYAGGYRPQRILPSGFTSGGTAQVDLEDFSGDDPFAWMLLSGSPGNFFLPFGDGRNLGLVADAFFLATITNPATFAVALAGGSGSTASFPVPLPPGTTLYGAALSYSLGGTVEIGEITDVETISIP